MAETPTPSVDDPAAILPLTSVEVWNFRAIEHLVVALHPRLNVFIGENGAGKTSLLEAIAAGLGAVASRAQAGHGQLLTPRQIRRQGDVVSAFAGVRVSAHGLEWTQYVRRDKTKQTRASRRAAMGHHSVTELNARIDTVIFAVQEDPNSEVLLPVIASYGTDRAVVKPVLRPEHLTEDDERLGAYKGCLTARTDFKAVFAWIMDRMMLEALVRVQNPQEFDAGLVAIRRAVEQAVPGATNLRVEQRPLRLVVDLKTADGRVTPLAPQDLSGGQRVMLALVADLARRMVQANPSAGLSSPAVVLIDEVDLHLHPRWQTTVLDTLLEIFPRAQFVVTTHSEQIISSVPSECLLRLDATESGVQAARLPPLRGATWDETLVDGMGLELPRPASAEALLRRLWDLASEDEGDTPAAHALRDEIRADWPGAASELARISFEVRRRAALAARRGPS